MNKIFWIKKVPSGTSKLILSFDNSYPWFDLLPVKRLSIEK